MVLAVEANQDSRYVALLEQSERLAEALVPGDIASVALELILRVTGLDEGTIGLLDRRRNEVITLARRGPLSSALEAMHETESLDQDCVSRMVVRDTAVWFCEDIHMVSNVPSVTRQVMDSVGASALMMLPLQVKHDVIGTLSLLHRTPWPCSLADLEVIGALAHQAAVALDRARRFTAAERRAARLETLSEIQQAIAGNMSQAALLQTVYRQTARVLDAHSFSVFTHSTEQGRQRCIFGVRDHTVLDPDTQIPGGCFERYQTEALQNLRAVIVDDTTSANRSFEPSAAVRSLLIVPLIRGSESIGLIQIGTRRSMAYSEEDAQLLRTIAAQTAAALDNIRLYESVSRQAAERSAILENLSEGLTIADGTGAILQINRAACRLFGLTASVFVRHDSLAEASIVLTSVEGRRLEPHERPLQRALHGENFSNYEVVVKPLGEHPRALSFSGGPILDDGGNLVLALTVCRDVTSLREVERLKDEFVTLVSHELRSPLTTLSGYAQLLDRHIARNDVTAYRADLSQMQSAIVRLQRLIDDLTDTTRLETGRLRLLRSETDPVAIVRRTIQAVIAAMPDHPVHLTAPQRSITLVADAVRLEQAITNLLTNACKYSSEGAPVLVTVAEVEHDLQVSIQDQGVGIDPEETPHVFDRFFRASNTGQAEGSGLGLYITRRLIEAHGGRIWVESTPGIGSVFTFTVPLHQSEVNAALTA